MFQYNSLLKNPCFLVLCFVPLYLVVSISHPLCFFTRIFEQHSGGVQSVWDSDREKKDVLLTGSLHHHTTACRYFSVTLNVMF